MPIAIASTAPPRSITCITPADFMVYGAGAATVVMYFVLDLLFARR
jgi:hypothetical protein